MITVPIQLCVYTLWSSMKPHDHRFPSLYPCTSPMAAPVNRWTSGLIYDCIMKGNFAVASGKEVILSANKSPWCWGTEY